MHEEYEIEDDDPDVCHHGRCFDEDCEECEDEIEAARIQESADRKHGARTMTCTHFDAHDNSMLGTDEDGTVECATCKARFVPASKLGAQQTAVEQARRDLRQALDIMENGRDDSEAFRVVRLRIYQAGKQLASVEQPK